MYERRYGSKYHESHKDGYLSNAQIAALIRADIKAAVKAGDVPKDLKISVTSETYSGGGSVNVVVDSHEGLHRRGKHPHWPDNDDVWLLTEEGQRVKKALEAIHWAYNYNGSEIMVDYFDVNYYGGVDITDPDSQAWRDSERARQAQARLDAPRKKEVIDLLVAKSPFYKRGRLRNASLERLEALLVKVQEKEAVSS